MKNLVAIATMIMAIISIVYGTYGISISVGPNGNSTLTDPISGLLLSFTLIVAGGLLIGESIFSMLGFDDPIQLVIEVSRSKSIDPQPALFN